jgi:hypothetical protein
MSSPRRAILRWTCSLAIAAVLFAARSPIPAAASPTIAVIAPANAGTVDAAIAGSTVEDFEDVNLIPGLTITVSVWRNNLNQITANGPIIYSGALAGTWDPISDGFSNNTWDGSRALVNGWGHDWAYPFASSVRFDFVPPRPLVGIGCANFQFDVTAHALFVNDVSMGNIEALPGWVDTIVYGRNGYVLISGEPIHSLEFRANTHFDGLVFDKLAVGSESTPIRTTSWGRVKGLYR